MGFEALRRRVARSHRSYAPIGPTTPSWMARGRRPHGWQAIMDHLRSLPVRNMGELPVIPVDERAAEVRAIKEG